MVGLVRLESEPADAEEIEGTLKPGFVWRAWRTGSEIEDAEEVEGNLKPVFVWRGGAVWMVVWSWFGLRCGEVGDTCGCCGDGWGRLRPGNAKGLLLIVAW